MAVRDGEQRYSPGRPDRRPANRRLGRGVEYRAVLDGIRAGRSWIAESAAVELSLKAAAGDRAAGIGERLDTCGETAVVLAEVHGVPSGVASIHTDQGAVHRASLPDSGSGTVEWRTIADESQFVRIEVRHPEGRMAALSNPILLT
jgi:hypothetical protein